MGYTSITPQEIVMNWCRKTIKTNKIIRNKMISTSKKMGNKIKIQDPMEVKSILRFSMQYALILGCLRKKWKK